MRLAGIIAIVLAALCLPAGASAATRYVDVAAGEDTTACTAQAEPCETIQHAVDEASGGDTVRIAAGTYEESVVSEKPLAFFGQGIGATTVRGPDGATAPGETALDLRRGTVLFGLHFQGGEGDTGERGGDAIVFRPEGPDDTETLSLLTVTAGGGGGAPGGDGLHAEGEGASVTTTAANFDSEGSDGAAVVASDGAEVAIESGFLEGPRGASAEGASLSLSRSRVLASGAGVEAIQTEDAGADVEVVDSLVAASGNAVHVQTTDSNEEPASLEARGATLVSAEAAVKVEKASGEYPDPTATLVNTIARDLSASGPVDLEVSGLGTIEADHSSFTTIDEGDEGTVTEPGSGGNVAGDPEFVAPNSGDPAAGDYRLAPSSPLIDAGDPGIVEPGELDLSGSLRSLDSDEDCVAAPDIGAYELSGHEALCDLPDDDSGDDDAPRTSSPPDFSFAAATLPAAPVAVTRFSVTNRAFAPAGGKARSAARRAKRGTRFLYRLSKPAQVVIRIVATGRTRQAFRRALRRCQRRASSRRARRACHRHAFAAGLARKRVAAGGSIFFNGRRGRKPLFPGLYTAAISAKEGGGLSPPRRLRVRVLRG